MTQPTQSPTITTQKAWGALMNVMGRTNLSRAGQARKAANALSTYLGRL